MPLSQIFYVANMSFNAIPENKILTKISDLQYLHRYLIRTSKCSDQNYSSNDMLTSVFNLYKSSR